MRSQLSREGQTHGGSESASERLAGASASGFRLVEGWRRLVAPPAVPASASFAERERARRGLLAGGLLLALLVIEVGALFQFVVVDDDHPAMKVALGIALALSAVAAALNRSGRVTAAGLLLIALADLSLVSIPATAIGGRFDIVDLGALYLTAGSVLVAASTLAPWSVFPVAAINSALMLLIVVVMPHTTAVDQLIASNNAQQAFSGPLLMQAIVAFVAYFWAQSVLTALRRADRAEEVAELERREVERTRELEQGVRELLAVHVQLANGNFQARSVPIRNQLLWQIGNSLNILIGRLARLAQVDFLLRRTESEAQRVAEAIRVMRSGRQPVWPTSSGTPLDVVVVALTAPSPGVPGASAEPPPYPFAPAAQASGEPSAAMDWPGVTPQPAPEPGSEASLPEWLRYPSLDGGWPGDPSR